jgi:hypothetical protein
MRQRAGFTVAPPNSRSRSEKAVTLDWRFERLALALPGGIGAGRPSSCKLGNNRVDAAIDIDRRSLILPIDRMSPVRYLAVRLSDI